MRKSLILLAGLFGATPALAQPAPPPPSDIIQMPRELTDPATADRLAGTMQVLSKAFLDMRIGEIKAAAEGHQATAAERRMTVREIARREDPNFDRKFERQVAQSGPMIHQGMKALSDALPEMMQGLAQAQRALERAAANMPDPTYPKR
jgi:hypothetical protein